MFYLLTFYSTSFPLGLSSSRPEEREAVGRETLGTTRQG